MEKLEEVIIKIGEEWISDYEISGWYTDIFLKISYDKDSINFTIEGDVKRRDVARNVKEIIQINSKNEYKWLVNQIIDFCKIMLEPKKHFQVSKDKDEDGLFTINRFLDKNNSNYSNSFEQKEYRNNVVKNTITAIYIHSHYGFLKINQHQIIDNIEEEDGISSRDIGEIKFIDSWGLKELKELMFKIKNKYKI
tara:strand:- start:374 stop:955 length:582 start_codon:yes stop_codon:yes gene_type:complete